MDILRTMDILVEYPFLALVPALVFATLYKKSKNRYILALGLLWMGYLVYEYGMKLRILCSGECNIRIDLLLIYPILMFTSLAGLVLSAAIFLRNNRV